MKYFRKLTHHVYTPILWITLYYALGACSKKQITQHIGLNKALVAGSALGLGQAMSVPSNDTALVPKRIDPSQVFFPVLLTIRNDSSLEELNANNVEIYLPEMHEIEQSIVDGTIDYQQLKTMTPKDDDPIGTPIETSIEQRLPVASIAFAKGVAINVLGAGLKSCFIKIRKRDSPGHRGFIGDHGTHLHLVKAGTYLILMSVALYLELQQDFQRADLLTTWSNAGITDISHKIFRFFIFRVNCINLA